MNFIKYPLSIFAVGFIACSLLAAAPLHKFYLSIFEFTYKEETKTVEVTGRIFTDDLEAALEKGGAEKSLITGETNKEETNAQIQQYLEKYLSLKINGKKVQFSFLGKEVEDDITWVYLEVTQVMDFTEIKVENRILSEVQDKQTNIIYLFKGTEELSLLLKDGDWVGTGKF